MAEIVGVFFTVFFEKLASETLKKIARSKGIDSELKKLERSLIQIQYLLNDASQKEITEKAVKAWLNGLQQLAYDIDDLLDDLATKVMHRELIEESGALTSKVRKLIPTSCTNFLLSTRMKGKLDKIMFKLQKLVDEKNDLGLSVKGESSKHMNMKRRLETCLVDASTIVGRESDKETLLQKLLADERPGDNNFSIVPIVGMGGVGKTTMARILYEEMQGKDHFEIKAWVCVSDEFDILNISQTIFQSVGGGNQEFKDLNLLQVALKEKISNKRFLFVLDDVWTESYTDWEILARPFLAGAPGSKVIMTTRKQSLLSQLGYIQTYHMSVLSHDNALSLFSQHALGENNFDSYPVLKPYGEGIVQKCDGLPLALIAVGRLLRSKTDVEEWKDVLNSEIWRLSDKDEIVPALRLSYHELSACLKQLFAYCSLFPKDYEFDKEELVLLWMAEGFLHQSTRSKSMERWGLECFEELLSRSFFQHAPNDKSLFVMHDLMNDLATFVAGEFFARLDIQTKKEFEKEAPEKYRHMSLVCERYMIHGRFKALKGAKSLRTFLALSSEPKYWPKYWQTSSMILDGLLHELPLLRVLNLSHLGISEVPEVIGSLKNLRYLNLSRTEITHLPDNVCNLYNLQTLILFGCVFLDKLPESFSNLKNLRHLDIGNTKRLKKLPLGIGELKSLRTLSKIIIEGDDGFSMADLKDLKDLQGKISVVGLEKVQSLMHVQEVNFGQKRISELEVEWSDVFDGSRKEALEKEVLNALKPDKDNLKKLKVTSYGGMMFPNWVGDPSFIRLDELSISGCKTCTRLPLLGQLPSLKKLFIKGMDEVTLVGSELLGTRIAFPSLEFLSFDSMQGWEAWSMDNSADVDIAFPCLRTLSLYVCPKLVKVSLEALPSLSVLKITNCGHQVLRSLVHVGSSVTWLSICNISGLNDEVWGSVIEHLGAVEEVHISRCNEIRYLWESETEASKVLVNLRKLEVSECSKLVSLGEKEEDNCGSNLTSLTVLEVYRCNNLEHLSCPNSIESLGVDRCESITSVSFPKGGGQKLKSVSIGKCEKFLEEVGGGGVLINSSMRMLEVIGISCWPNLKSVVELSSFIHLTKLRIVKCPSMESFPDHELLNLVMLKHLTIKVCESMDVSFPRGLWPPKLSSLEIGRLKKPMSEWGPQNFPTSLVDLKLYGGASEDDVSNFSLLSHLLPSSLTSLTIDGFKKLGSVSKGLQHLTSLNHLCICRCPKMMDLPDMLLPSLLSLFISDCPNLKESSRRGSYRPLISLIPSINIYDGPPSFLI